MRYESVAFFSSPDHELRVQILDNSLTPIATVFSASDLIFTTHYSIGDFGADLFPILTSRQGELVYLQFEQQNDLGCWPLNIDNISLLIDEVIITMADNTAEDPLPIPTLGQLGIIILSLGILIVGVISIQSLVTTREGEIL